MIKFLLFIKKLIWLLPPLKRKSKKLNDEYLRLFVERQEKERLRLEKMQEFIDPVTGAYLSINLVKLIDEHINHLNHIKFIMELVYHDKPQNIFELDCHWAERYLALLTAHTHTFQGMEYQLRQHLIKQCPNIPTEFKVYRSEAYDWAKDFLWKYRMDQ